MSFTPKGIAGILFLVLTLTTTTTFAQTGQNATQQTQQIEVTDAELEKFAQAFQRIRMLNQKAQQQMSQTIENEGLDVQRFNEIHQASLDPAVEVEITEKEQGQYDIISAEIEKIQTSFRPQMEEVITQQGLTLQEYEQIVAQLQRDPELQERLRAVFDNNQGE